MRHEELHKGLSWEPVDLAKGTLIVPVNIGETKRKRKIDMAENLQAWLVLYRGRSGKIYAKDSDSPIVKTSKAAGVL